MFIIVRVYIIEKLSRAKYESKALELLKENEIRPPNIKIIVSILSQFSYAI